MSCLGGDNLDTTSLLGAQNPVSSAQFPGCLNGDDLGNLCPVYCARNSHIQCTVSYLVNIPWVPTAPFDRVGAHLDSHSFTQNICVLKSIIEYLPIHYECSLLFITIYLFIIRKQDDFVVSGFERR